MRILVLDDSPRHTGAAKVQLSKNHDVVITTSYNEALECIKTRPFDAVLTDLRMLVEEEDITQTFASEAENPQFTEGHCEGNHNLGDMIVNAARLSGVPLIGLLSDKEGHSFPILEVLKHQKIANTSVSQNGAYIDGRSIIFVTSDSNFMGWRAVHDKDETEFSGPVLTAQEHRDALAQQRAKRDACRQEADSSYSEDTIDELIAENRKARDNRDIAKIVDLISKLDPNAEILQDESKLAGPYSASSFINEHQKSDPANALNQPKFTRVKNWKALLDHLVETAPELYQRQTFDTLELAYAEIA